MSLVFRPVVTYPVRCGAPVFFRPSVREVAPIFSLFDESFAQLERAARHAQRAQFKRPFNPKFDVKEAQESYLLEGELPGFDPKDISIEFLDDGHTLQIKGKYVKETQGGQQNTAKAVESTETPKAVEATPATEQPSETSSVKSHQATVEDDAEEPANASAAVESQPQETVAESSKPAEKQEVAKQEQQETPKKWISERYSGSFSRSFKFPSKVDQEAVKASLKDGILAITLPFARKPESRRIQIE